MTAVEKQIDAFAKLRTLPPNSPEALTLSKQWQDFITKTQYTCTDEMILYLADLYVTDERFRKNIDAHGKGTAQFMSDSLKAYVQSHSR